MQENARAELEQRDADISRLKEQLVRCQIEQTGAELSTAAGVQAPKVKVEKIHVQLYVPSYS